MHNSVDLRDKPIHKRRFRNVALLERLVGREICYFDQVCQQDVIVASGQ